MTHEEKQIKVDRMRYTKDKLSSNLVLLAIVLDALYFISIYSTDVTKTAIADAYLYTSWVIGASIIVNLVFLLAAFLASEAVKNRRGGFTIPLIVLGLVQIGRIFYLPAKARVASLTLGTETLDVMGDKQYLYVAALLAASGVCCLVAALNSARNNRTLARYMRSMEEESV